MGKCVAGGYTPYFEKTVCDGCLHKDVCGNSDYLTENSCSDKIECSLTHLRELLAAAKEGRLVVVPCKVGETVWVNFSIAGSYLREKDKPYACTVLFVGLNQSESGGYINFEYQKSGYQFQLDFDKFGKTVFLTREEAQAALGKEREQ